MQRGEREREPVQRERTHFPESPFWQVDRDTAPPVLSAAGFLWEQLGGGTLRCSRSSPTQPPQVKPPLGSGPPALDRGPHKVPEELLAARSVMSVLIATQHFHTTASKVVSQVVRSSFWPRVFLRDRFLASNRASFCWFLLRLCH